MTALRLYRQFLKEGKKFSSYNFREYVGRKTRFAFEQNRNVTDRKLLDELFYQAQQDLALIRRQTTINNMYKSESLIIESKPQSSSSSH